jgi:hypothetical protein
LTGRRDKEGGQVAAEIKELGGDAAFFRADVAKDADVKANYLAAGCLHYGFVSDLCSAQRRGLH